MSDNKKEITQTVKIEAGYSYDTATEIIMDLIMDGFSVEASIRDREWLITGEKPRTNSKTNSYELGI